MYLSSLSLALIGRHWFFPLCHIQRWLPWRRFEDEPRVANCYIFILSRQSSWTLTNKEISFRYYLQYVRGTKVKLANEISLTKIYKGGNLEQPPVLKRRMQHKNLLHQRCDELEYKIPYFTLCFLVLITCKQLTNLTLLSLACANLAIFSVT